LTAGFGTKFFGLGQYVSIKLSTPFLQMTNMSIRINFDVLDENNEVVKWMVKNVMVTAKK
jgi:hypothetical protein